MAKFFVLSLCVAAGAAAPSYVAPAHVAHAAVVPHVAGAYVARGPTHVQETIHAGPAVAEHHVQHGVVGYRAVQAGARTVQVGHQYVQAGQSVHHPAAYSVVASPASTSSGTRPLPLAPLPVASPAAAIPKPYVNLGPAPSDAVTQEKVLAPGRPHTIITPQVTRIEPEIQVNRYAVHVPKAVPVPVEKIVVDYKHVPKPYTVEVPTPYHVPQPYKVHQVKNIVETPVIHKQTYTVQRPVGITRTVAYGAAPVAAYGAATYGAATYGAATYGAATYGAAPAVAYAGAPAVAYAGAPAVAYGAAPVAAPVVTLGEE